MRMPELKALNREHRLRGYSQLKKAELIELIRNGQWNTNLPLQSWEPSIPRGHSIDLLIQIDHRRLHQLKLGNCRLPGVASPHNSN